MKISVKVKPNARESLVKKLDDKTFSVWVKEPPTQGKANQALIRTLSQYFKITQQDIKILIGHRSKQKIISIQNL
ncbi:MAG: hypothetical protein A2Y98_03440 [Candidatus Portnoybacteria bacterium RBG_19FT_COMBO_36_7]|uniref:UPF0235 protein A2Y98_03440 n=1 Tax=Candidatus Portnoybacteria bacterium RBG_19FT_COMBO_36_7 TaxID=1801992 RepID=A0A1G2F7Z7_9BACT|nr:MAG: hypothetical protein A2Y98_03440 [Candidatus Portnoybacteria bacterium RBG_19FT_COMBO_36_7]